MNRRDFPALTTAMLAASSNACSEFSAAPDDGKADGQNYAPRGKPNPVVGPGEFAIADCADLVVVPTWPRTRLLGRGFAAGRSAQSWGLG